jgi:hypothetical protein
MAFTTCRSRDAARPALCFSLLPGTRGQGVGCRHVQVVRLKVEEVKVEASDYPGPLYSSSIRLSQQDSLLYT